MAISNNAIANTKFFRLLLIVFTSLWIFFALQSIDMTDWWLENILVFIGLAWLSFPANRRIFSQTALMLIFLFLLLHIYGAKMAYTMNDLGELLQNRFELKRNPYDRIVHFSFGLLLLIPVFEFISAKTEASKKLNLIIANMAIFCAASAFELIEWVVAIAFDSATGETYVATQGDTWDAQKDIALAVIGAGFASLMVRMKRKSDRLYV